MGRVTFFINELFLLFCLCRVRLGQGLVRRAGPLLGLVVAERLLDGIRAADVGFPEAVADLLVHTLGDLPEQNHVVLQHVGHGVWQRHQRTLALVERYERFNHARPVGVASEGVCAEDA